MKNQQKQTLAKHNNDLPSTMLTKVRDKIITIKGQNVISDADVADLYGVETNV